jgi:hypothetical protein
MCGVVIYICFTNYKGIIFIITIITITIITTTTTTTTTIDL